MKIISQRREQARWAYDGAVLEVKKEIPVYMRFLSLSVLTLFVLAAALTGSCQQTNIPMFSTYAAYSYFGTPSINLVQRGFDGDIGYNMRPWLTLGFDFSYGDGSNSILPQYLKPSLQAQLLPLLAQLPQGYQLYIPGTSKDYTYEAGPQFNYRRFKHVTLFARPALGAIHFTFTPHPIDPIQTAVVTAVLGSPNKTATDTVVFYGFGGGVTWEVTPNFGIRTTTDFVHYDIFSNLLNGGRNSFRVTVGTKFSFGKNIVAK